MCHKLLPINQSPEKSYIPYIKENDSINLSDHGEILGENGKWLHAQNSDASTNPAMIVWYSNTLKKSYPFLIKNLKLNSEKNISTDFFYHSILDLLEVDNIEYNKYLSIFN